MLKNSTGTLGGALLIGLAAVGGVRAQTAPGAEAAAAPTALEQRVQALEAKVREQQMLLERQGRELDGQVLQLEARQRINAAQRREAMDAQALGALRGAGMGRDAAPAPVLALAPAPPGEARTEPVGEAPPAPEPSANLVAVLPDNSGVLTPPGHWALEPALTYSRSSSDRLVFQGVEIVTGVQIGVIEADKAARDSDIATLTARYGLTRRAEIQIQAPFVYRNDLITTLAQRDSTITRASHLSAGGIGDVEITGRYQVNDGRGGWPVLVANLRVKSDTGSNPYKINRDQFGVASELALGSGFWALEPSLSVLLVSDPVVMFGNVSYLHSFPANINQTIGNVLVGRVTPGDSVGASLGFGFSLNPQFSFSLGYRHNYLFGTTTELGPTLQRSQALTVGALLLGMSYRVSSRMSLNTQFEFGVTSDSPDVTITFRTPISF
jgi:hypothetical protein